MVTSILSLGNSTENTSGGQMLPPRIVVNNKLIYTERLVADLRFWVEVERQLYYFLFLLFVQSNSDAKPARLDDDTKRRIVNKESKL